MKKANRSNALLVELLIVVIFFMLAATVLLQVFTASRNQGRIAGAINDSLVEAQNVADRLYAAEGDEAGLLQAMGFEADGDGWRLEKEAYSLRVTLSAEARAAGNMRQARVTAYDGEDALFTLPVSRYEEGRK